MLRGRGLFEDPPIEDSTPAIRTMHRIKSFIFLFSHLYWLSIASNRFTFNSMEVLFGAEFLQKFKGNAINLFCSLFIILSRGTFSLL